MPVISRDRIPANALFITAKVSLLLLFDRQPRPTQQPPSRARIYSFCWISTLLSHFQLSEHPPKELFDLLEEVLRHPILAMEYHFVPPEERARDEKGNLLPWGYVYKE